MLEKVFSLIAKPKLSTASDYSRALEALDINAAEAALADLESRRQDLLLKIEADDELSQLNAQITAANLDIERRYAAKRKLEDLLAAAEESERVAGIEGRANEASTVIRPRMIRNYVELHQQAERLVELLNAIEGDRVAIQAVNQLVGAAKRPDLKVAFPVGMLAERLGVPVTSFPQLGLWSLQGYTTIWNKDRRFGRMHELL